MRKREGLPRPPSTRKFCGCPCLALASPVRFCHDFFIKVLPQDPCHLGKRRADDGPLVELIQISRVYDGGRVVALWEASLAVAPGEFLAIAGPSGSGKSTLLHLMCGLDSPTAGRVLFEGQERDCGRAWCRLRARRIGFVFQEYNLLPRMTASENVQAAMFGVLSSARLRDQRARELLDRVGLGHRLHHLPSELSGGERQRAAIARSLANGPDLILADEPTGSLDSAVSSEIIALLAEVRAAQKVALVLVTHDAAVADRADRIVRLRNGRIEGEERR